MRSTFETVATFMRSNWLSRTSSMLSCRQPALPKARMPRGVRKQ